MGEKRREPRGKAKAIETAANQTALAKTTATKETVPEVGDLSANEKGWSSHGEKEDDAQGEVGGMPFTEMLRHHGATVVDQSRSRAQALTGIDVISGGTDGKGKQAGAGAGAGRDASEAAGAGAPSVSSPRRKVSSLKGGHEQGGERMDKAGPLVGRGSGLGKVRQAKEPGGEVMSLSPREQAMASSLSGLAAAAVKRAERPEPAAACCAVSVTQGPAIPESTAVCGQAARSPSTATARSTSAAMSVRGLAWHEGSGGAGTAQEGEACGVAEASMDGIAGGEGGKGGGCEGLVTDQGEGGNTALTRRDAVVVESAGGLGV